MSILESFEGFKSGSRVRCKTTKKIGTVDYITKRSKLGVVVTWDDSKSSYKHLENVEVLES